MRRWGAGALAVVLLAGFAAWVKPWLTKPRDAPASVPSPRALESVDLIPLRSRASVCSRYNAMDAHTARATITVITGGRPGAPLALSMVGPGYRQTARIPGGYPDESAVFVAVRPPSRAMLVRACVRNEGVHQVRIAASGDRTRSRSIAVLDGKPTEDSYWLTFYEAGPHSIARRLPLSLRRMSTFRPGVVGPWLLWPLALAMLFGVPLAVLWAWQRALASEDDPDEPGGPVGEPDEAPPVVTLVP
jgi:hypothetical protein